MKTAYYNLLQETYGWNFSLLQKRQNDEDGGKVRDMLFGWDNNISIR